MDDGRLREVYAVAYPRLVGQLVGVTGDPAEAEDAVMEAFARAAPGRSSFHDADNPEAWLRTVAVNVARSRWRRVLRWTHLVPSLARSEAYADLPEDHLALMAAMCTALDGAERTGEHLEQSETPTAVVDWYAPTDLVAMSRVELGRDSEEIGQTEERPEDVLQQHGTWSFEELSATSYVRPGVPPTFVAHGTDDQIVPVDHSRELVARLRAAGAEVEYLEVPGADHVWRGAPSVTDIVAASLAFVAKTL